MQDLMQITARKKISPSVAVAIFVIVLFAFTALTGCGGSDRSTNALAVVDSGNNRVLIYSAPFSTNQSASLVLGQAGFTTSAAALTATGMNMPIASLEDNVGNLYISDCQNYRILQFQPPFANGMSASLVIGQPDFVTGTPNTTQNGLGNTAWAFGAAGMAFDSNGNLWAADFGNSRILRYSPPFANNMNANLVIGQANFTSRSTSDATINAASLYGPTFLAFDASGNLWAVDQVNNRVLEYTPPFANGMSASLVLGQAGFTTGASATTASGFTVPAGVAFDGAGNLWIADAYGNRVLQFKPPFTTGMSASLVLGQADFTTSTAATTANGLNGPIGIAFDSLGNLIVPEENNNRTLVFTPPFSNNMNATLVLGQPDFTTNTATTTATGQSDPVSVLPMF